MADLSRDLVRTPHFLLGEGSRAPSPHGTRLPLPSSFGYWRDFAGRYVAAVCARGEDTAIPIVPPDPELLATLAASAPPMIGGEYIDQALLVAQWRVLDDGFAKAMQAHHGSVAELLHARHSAWHLVGRVHFNLAENRGDDEAPFAFLATYTTRLSTRATAQHVPLGQALREYVGARAKPQLEALLAPVRRASAQCPWLAEIVESGELFHPLRWTPEDALRMLADTSKLESAGVIVRMPAGWGGSRPSRPRATAIVGSKPAGGIGRDALLEFRAEVDQSRNEEVRSIYNQTREAASTKLGDTFPDTKSPASTTTPNSDRRDRKGSPVLSGSAREHAR